MFSRTSSGRFVAPARLGVVTALEFRVHPFGPDLVRGIQI